MKKFLKRLLIFLIPIIALAGLPTYVLWKSKENFNRIDNLTASNEKYLIGYAYHENNYGYLKWAYLNSNEKKTIWAVGTSRVLSLRQNMFDSSFYNAGYTILSLNDFRPFLKSIPSGKLPEYLIIGLDQWMFNPAQDALNSMPSEDTWQSSFSFYPKLSTYRNVCKDLFVGKYTINSLEKANAIYKVGLNAKVNNKGFKNDGSMYYGDQIVKLMNHDTTALDYNYTGTLERIKEGNRLFQYGNSIHAKALLELEQLLKFCKKHQIQVVAFLPPFADRVYNKMSESGKYGYMKECYSKMRPLFDKYQYELYDFPAVSVCGSNDRETIDGFHGGAVTYQRLLIKMLESGSVLNQVSNAEKLKRDLQNRKNNYVVYED